MPAIDVLSVGKRHVSFLNVIVFANVASTGHGFGNGLDCLSGPTQQLRGAGVLESKSGNHAMTQEYGSPWAVCRAQAVRHCHTLGLQKWLTAWGMSAHQPSPTRPSPIAHHTPSPRVPRLLGEVRQIRFFPAVTRGNRRSRSCCPLSS